MNQLDFVGGIVHAKVRKLDERAIMPAYQTDGAACFDLHAIIDEPIGHATLRSGLGGLVVRTGLAFEVPDGHVMLVYSRSGHGFKHDTRLANCVGVIDSDYRGEVMVKLTQDGNHHCPLLIRHGDRVAQAMIVPIPRVQLVEVSDLSGTDRGAGGFGSTG